VASECKRERESKTPILASQVHNRKGRPREREMTSKRASQPCFDADAAGTRGMCERANYVNVGRIA